MHVAHITVLLCLVLLAGCRNRADQRQEQPEIDVAAADADASPDSLPRHIYYDLTSYGWYQRAEPLVIAPDRYVPRGAPVAIPLAKLRLAGNYQGVDFYVLHDEKEPPETIYVPVYRGYWLPFIAAPAAAGQRPS